MKQGDAIPELPVLRDDMDEMLTSSGIDATKSNAPLTLWDRLVGLYSPEDARLWLISPQAILGGRIAAELLARGDLASLHRVLDQSEAGEGDSLDWAAE